MAPLLLRQPDLSGRQPMTCPHCNLAMTPHADDRWECPACPRIAITGETPDQIEAAERRRVAVRAALEGARVEHRYRATVPAGPVAAEFWATVGPLLVDAPSWDSIERETELLEAAGCPAILTNGQEIQTRGCSKCGGTMYKTKDLDDDGNTNWETNYICSNCGAIE